MIAGDAKVKERNPVFADSVPQPGAVFDSVESIAQEEFTVMAAVGEMIDVAGLDVTVCARHGEASVM
jgi:hypothetical protein